MGVFCNFLNLLGLSVSLFVFSECTVDYHIIFAVRYNSASVPVDPTNLFIPGSNCKPVLVNDKVAIYKFRVTECGVRAYVSWPPCLVFTVQYTMRQCTSWQVLH